MFSLPQTLKILELKTLSRKQAYNLQQAILANKLTTDELIEVFELMGNRFPTKDELLGFVQASREVGTTIDFGKHVFDISGTGTEKVQTFNISTIASFVLASLGVRVVKHGNKGTFGMCTGADLAEELGIKIDLTPKQASKIFNDVGVVFLWSPLYNPAFRYVKEARLLYGKRTYFNFLNPLLNPANPEYQVIGVLASEMMTVTGEVLMELGSQHILLVYSEDGIDEISPSGVTQCVEYITREVALSETDSELERYTLEKHLAKDPYLMREFTIDPHLAHLQLHIKDIQGGDVEVNTKIALNILDNRGNDGQIAAVLLNSAAGLMVTGKAADFDQGIKMSSAVLQNGEAKDLVNKLVNASSKK